MRNTSSANSPHTRTQSENLENHSWTPYETSVLLAMSGGALCELFGLLSLFASGFSMENKNLFNYAGVGLLFLAFTLCSVGAHFMDVSDSRKRLNRKQRVEEFLRNNNDFQS